MSGFVLVPLIYKSSPILFYGQNVQTGWRAQVEHEVMLEKAIICQLSWKLTNLSQLFL